MNASHSTPVFNLPTPVKLLVVAMVLLHIPGALGMDALSGALLGTLAFVPLRFSGSEYWWSDPLASVLSPLGYTLLHADWLHLGVNLGMLIAFGKVVWLVLGARTFWVTYCLGGLSGALIVALTTEYPQYPLLGASASISAMVGALCCAGIFQRHTLPFPFDSTRRSQQMLLVWVGLNLAIAVLPHAAFASNFAIAWQAHLAGLAAGFACILIGMRGNTPPDQS